MLGGLTGCQSQQPSKRGIHTVKVRNIHSYVEFVARQRERNQDSKVSAADSHYAETIFEENLGLELDGYAYHPNFVEFTLGGLFGLLQHDYEATFATTDRSSSDDGTVLEFDAVGHFLKKKKYPGSIYARRYRAIQPRPFQASLDTTSENYGFNWQYVSSKTPTYIQFNQTKVNLDPLDDAEEETRQVNTDFRFETAYKFSESNVLSLTYNRRSVEEEPFGFDYDSDEVTLAHRLNFGDARQHTLESELNYFDQRGTFEINRARWRETLRLQHTEDLRSIFQFEAIQREQGTLAGLDAIKETSYFGSAMLEHNLYDSLVTQIMGYAQTQEFDSDATNDRYGGQLSLDYRKKNPWGRLLANYVSLYQKEDRDGRDLVIQVIDERHTLRDPDPAVLDGTNINVGSIQIMNADRSRLLQLGRDYSITMFVDRVEIRRVPTGFIADGDAILVSYTFDLGSAFQLDTIGQNVHVRQDFSFGLSPYYRLRWQDQTISPSMAAGIIAEDIEAHIFGVEYRWRRFRFSAEHEDHHSSINPFKAIRLSATLGHRFKTGGIGSIRTRWIDISREPPNDRDTTLFTVEGRYRQYLARGLTFEGSVLYRSEDDSRDGDDDGFDLDLSLEWLIRQTELRITYELGRFEDDFAKTDYTALYVQLRRHL